MSWETPTLLIVSGLVALAVWKRLGGPDNDRP